MFSSATQSNKLTKIGIFYDGNYFFHVSNYYLYQHERKARISISGLHQFIMAEIAKAEENLQRHCRIVDAHYFRGRISAQDAQARDLLFKERIFEDILMREGVITHYLPLSPDGEKGIDVWLALEAFELAIYKKFDVSVLIASDGDYLPLIRKLNTLGTRVMVLGWDFSFVDQNGNRRETRTSQAILEGATYPVLMNSIIDNRSRRTDPLIDNLFVREKNTDNGHHSGFFKEKTNSEYNGIVIKIKKGYGFIRPENSDENLFFYYRDLIDCDFNDLNEGDNVSFCIGKNDQGACAKNVKNIIH
jgi:cold shock CspA family protein